MRFRRHCYDKPWRCPGCAGGGWKYPSDRRTVCKGGSLARYWDEFQDRGNRPLWRVHWQFHRCRKCGTIAIPHVTRWLDYTYVAFQVGRWWRDKRLDKKLGEPIFFRPSKGHVFFWEIYSWRHWFLTFSPGNFEFQFNKWPKKTNECPSCNDGWCPDPHHIGQPVGEGKSE